MYHSLQAVDTFSSLSKNSLNLYFVRTSNKVSEFSAISRVWWHEVTLCYWKTQHTCTGNPNLHWFISLLYQLVRLSVTYSVPFPYPSPWHIGHFVCMERWTFSLQNQETCDRSKSQPSRFPEFFLSWKRSPHLKLCFPDALLEWAPPMFWIPNLFSSSKRFVKY